MENTIRLFNCLRCHCQVFICSYCDRGNIYCGPLCAQPARSELLKATRKRYQKSRRGRFAHAQRQHHYRQRQKEKVMDQGSHFQPACVPLEKKPDKHEVLPHKSFICMDCSFCGQHRSIFIRFGFLRAEVRHKKYVASSFLLGP